MKGSPAALLLCLPLVLLAVMPLPLHAAKVERTADTSARHASVERCYSFWKGKYLIPSVRFPGAWKVDYNGKGATVSEAMGYGMLITVFMADRDPDAKKYFDGLDAFRKHFPSGINPAFMCWKIPADEKPRRDDSATDGDLDIAYALLLAHRCWGEERYLSEAKTLITNIAASLVRPDGSLRLGDWNEKPGQTRPSDLMPTHFRAFGAATGDPLWEKVEKQCYAILGELQEGSAPRTGLVPDFAVEKEGRWVPARPCFLEGRTDGDYSYNACRVPWRIGWAALTLNDERARNFLKPLMGWVSANIPTPVEFRSGYHLDGSSVRNSEAGVGCFLAPTGVAAKALGNKGWEDAVFSYGKNCREEYYSDSVNLLCLILMSGNQDALKWRP
jgi:endo-1,4-beta-D-glucanase Y